MKSKVSNKQAPGGSSNPHGQQKLSQGARVVKPAASNLMTGSSSTRGKGCK